MYKTEPTYLGSLSSCKDMHLRTHRNSHNKIIRVFIYPRVITGVSLSSNTRLVPQVLDLSEHLAKSSLYVLHAR